MIAEFGRWGGAALMAIAPAVSLNDRRHWVGAPMTAKARCSKLLQGRPPGKGVPA